MSTRHRSVLVSGLDAKETILGRIADIECAVGQTTPALRAAKRPHESRAVLGRPASTAYARLVQHDGAMWEIQR